MSVLEVFKSLPTVHDVLRPETLPAHVAGYDTDTITLGWEERLKARGRRRTDGGSEFGTALPRGTVLRDGDVLVVDAFRLMVTVCERAEPVLVIEPQTAVEWGLYGYHIGNSHQPVMLTDGEIVCVGLPGTEQILAQHGIPFIRQLRPFTPLGLLVDHRH
jgi:urease accessory protein